MAHSEYGDLILENWESGGPELRDVSSPPSYEDLAWAVGVNGIVMKRISESEWEETILLEGKYDFNGVHFVTEDTGWIVGAKNEEPDKFKGIILKTIDGGTSWNINRTFHSPVYDVYSPSQNVVWVAGGNGWVLKTLDAGQYWYDIFVEEARDSISNAFLSIWALDGSRAWVCGDNSGIVAKTTDGGTNWSCYYPFPKVYPGALEGYLTNLSVAGPDPTDFNDVYVTCSQGLIGHTTDGGGSWSTYQFDSDDQWFYTGWLSSSPFLAGGSSEMFINVSTGPYKWRHFGKKYDLLGSTSICDFVAGTNSAILWHYPYPSIVEDEITFIDAIGENQRVTVNWKGRCASSGAYYFYISRALTEHGPFKVIKTYEYNSPGDHYFFLAWDDSSVQYQQPYWYYVIMYPGVTRVPPDDGTPTGLPDPPIPPRPTNFEVTEIGGDQGWKLGLDWDLMAGVDTYYVYRKPNPWAIEELRYIGSSVPEELGVFEYIDTLALPGYSTYYEVRSYNGAAVSQPASGSGVSLDDRNPPKVTGLGAYYDEGGSYTYMEWNPVDDPTLGGYWASCMGLAWKSDEIVNDAPLQRCFHRFSADAPQVGVLELRVKAMDRSENMGTSSDPFYIGQFIRGDVNGSGTGSLTLSDALFCYRCQFLPGWQDSCKCDDATDANDNGTIAMSDCDYILDWLFVPGNPPPPTPFPDCGLDPTLDTLDCDWHPCQESGQLASEPTEFGGVLSLGEFTLKEHELTVPVYLASVETLSAFAWKAEYDPSIITAKTVDNTGLVTEEFDFFSARSDNDEGWVRTGALMSFTMEPSLPPGDYQIANMIFELDPNCENLEGILEVTDAELVHHKSYRVEIESGGGGGAMSSGSSVASNVFMLFQNRPNPFSSGTEISYSTAKTFHVCVKIYDATGHLVNTIVDEKMNPGYHTAQWDGKTDSGKEASSGIYFYRIEAGEYMATRKMVRMK